MNSLGLFALLLAVATLLGIINYRTLKLPLTIGILLISMLISLIVMILNPLFPGYDLQQVPQSLLGTINLPRTLLDGALSFLLFAGAMQVDLGLLLSRGKSVAALAILGTSLAVGLLAAPAWLIFPVFGLAVPSAGACCSERCWRRPIRFQLWACCGGWGCPGFAGDIRG